MTKGVFHIESGQGRTFHVLGGDVVTCKVTGKETDGMFALLETTVPVGGGPPPHVHHREDETFYVVNGEFEFYTPSGSVRSGTGDVVHAPRDIPHFFRNVGKEPEVLIVAVHPAGFENFIEEFSQIPVDRPPDMERMANLGAKYGIEFVRDVGSRV